MRKIILASQSPRRKQLLQWAEAEFDVLVYPTEETFPDDLNSSDVPVHIARQKAVAVLNSPAYKDNYLNLPVLAADTIVVCEGQILGKPKDRDDAMRILKMLSGKQHEVITGVVFLDNGKETSFSDITEVWFHSLTEEQIAFYIDRYQPYDKAGAYAIQEWIGVVGIQKINGDFYNVMGLPVSRVIPLLV